jgi:hypothetical protein
MGENFDLEQLPQHYRGSRDLHHSLPGDSGWSQTLCLTFRPETMFCRAGSRHCSKCGEACHSFFVHLIADTIPWYLQIDTAGEEACRYIGDSAIPKPVFGYDRASFVKHASSQAMSALTDLEPFNGKASFTWLFSYSHVWTYLHRVCQSGYSCRSPVIDCPHWF